MMLNDQKVLTLAKKTGNMLALSAPVRKFIGKQRDSSADSFVFQLHYIFTTGVLLTFAIVYWAKDLVGDPIRCFTDSRVVDDLKKAMETFCYMKSLYTLRDDSGVRQIYPGVGPISSPSQSTIGHTYYIWCSFFVLFLALLFYLPRFMWKRTEDGKFANFAGTLNKIILDKNLRDREFEELVDHFSNHLGHFNSYTIRFLLCEFMNLIVTLVSFIITDAYLENRFFTYGLKVIEDINQGNFDEFHHPKTMTRYFPLMAKCTLKYFGPSGSIIKMDTICILPLNNLNDKVFLFLWFYFIILAIVTTIWMIAWRMSPLLSSRIRLILLNHAIGKVKERNDVNIFVSNLSISDWFALFQLRKNMDWVYFKRFVISIAMHHVKNKDYDV